MPRFGPQGLPGQETHSGGLLGAVQDVPRGAHEDDEERGSVVRAVVVLRDDSYTPSPALVRELQEHVRRETAPYKYPRIVEFAAELPKTASGKIKRAELRARS